MAATEQLSSCRQNSSACLTSHLANGAIANDGASLAPALEHSAEHSPLSVQKHCCPGVHLRGSPLPGHQRCARLARIISGMFLANHSIPARTHSASISRNSPCTGTSILPAQLPSTRPGAQLWCLEPDSCTTRSAAWNTHLGVCQHKVLATGTFCSIGHQALASHCERVQPAQVWHFGAILLQQRSSSA